MNRTCAKREKQMETIVFEHSEIHRRIAGAVRSFPTAFASVCAARGMNLDSPT